MIVDSHAHIFPAIEGRVAAGRVTGVACGRVSINGEEVQALPPCLRRVEYTPEMLIAEMDWAGVEKAVLLQGPFYGACDQYVGEAVRRYPDRLSGAAYFDPWSAGSREALASPGALSGFRILKLEYSEATGLRGLHPEAELNAPDLGWLWDELERRGIVLVVDLGAVGGRSYQTKAVRAIAEEHLNMKVVVTHLGHPTPSVEADPVLWRSWVEQLDLGLLPNVWFDCASLPAYLPNEDYPYPTVARYLRLAIERVGPSKIMWGSDAPGLLLHATYRQLVRAAKLHTDFLPAEEQAMFLGGNAWQVYE